MFFFIHVKNKGNCFKKCFDEVKVIAKKGQLQNKLKKLRIQPTI